MSKHEPAIKGTTHVAEKVAKQHAALQAKYQGAIDMLRAGGNITEGNVSAFCGAWMDVELTQGFDFNDFQAMAAKQGVHINKDGSFTIDQA